MEWIEKILPYLLSFLTAIGGWIGGKMKKKNDFLSEMQKSIDLLTAENTKLVEKVVALNRDVIALRKENEELHAEIEKLNSLLSNIKSITRKKDEKLG